jgi:hypothetical protein
MVVSIRSPILSAPPTNCAYAITGAVFSLNRGNGVAYTLTGGAGGGIPTITYGTPLVNLDPNAASSTVAAQILTDGITRITVVPNTVGANISVAQAQNQPITLSLSVSGGANRYYRDGDPNSTLTIVINYTIVQFSA